MALSTAWGRALSLLFNTATKQTDPWWWCFTFITCSSYTFITFSFVHHWSRRAWVSRGLSSHAVWGGELPLKQIYVPMKKGHQLPLRGIPVLTTSWHAHCMLTFCYNTKQRAFILVKNKIVGHYVNTSVEHYSNVFVHKCGKLENRQFLDKIYQIAPKCVSNFEIPPIPGGATSPDPSQLASRIDSWSSATRASSDSFILPWNKRLDKVVWVRLTVHQHR